MIEDASSRNDSAHYSGADIDKYCENKEGGRRSLGMQLQPRVFMPTYCTVATGEGLLDRSSLKKSCLCDVTNTKILAILQQEGWADFDGNFEIKTTARDLCFEECVGIKKTKDPSFANAIILFQYVHICRK